MSTVTKTVLAAAVAEMSVPEVSGLRISQGSEAKRLVADPQCVEPQPGALMESIVGGGNNQPKQGGNKKKLPRGILLEISTYRSLTLLERFKQAQACKGTCRRLIQDKSGHIEWTCDRLEALVPVAEEVKNEIRDLEQQLGDAPEDILDIRKAFNDAYKNTLKEGAGKKAAGKDKDAKLSAEHDAIGRLYFEPLLEKRNALLEERTEQWSNFLKAGKSSMTVPPHAIEKALLVYQRLTMKTVETVTDFLPFQKYCKDLLKPFFMVCVNHDHTGTTADAIEEQIQSIDKSLQSIQILPGLDINVRYPDDINVNGKTVVKAGDTALRAAAGAGSLKVVGALLEKGMRVDACADFLCDGTHFYPLFFAARNGHEEVVKALLDKGADVNRKNGPGQFTALGAVAFLNDRVEVVKTLLKGGAKVNNVDKDGQNALTIACEKGHLDVVKVLCEAKTPEGKPYFTAEDYAQARSVTNREDILKILPEQQ